MLVFFVRRSRPPETTRTYPLFPSTTPLRSPLRPHAVLTVLSGNLFDGAVMKLSVISDAFRARFLSDPDDPDAFEGHVVVFDGPEDYHARIEDPALDIDERTILVIRGAGPVGYPGGAEIGSAHV